LLTQASQCVFGDAYISTATRRADLGVTTVRFRRTLVFFGRWLLDHIDRVGGLSLTSGFWLRCGSWLLIDARRARGRLVIVGGAHPVTGVAYPEAGLQPYYAWLIRSLHRLAEASAGDLRVWHDADAAASVWVAPGRCSIAGQALVYAGGSVGLGLYNNSTALIWLEDNAGVAEIGAADTGSGWPVGDHLKLAEAQLDSGEVTLITDRRFETLLQA